ncbi:hypothetical protein [Streptomyces sp. Y1]|uniref:Uncharacterized protein n=1 Tax=Streptomyces sp. Y1 TaxID=3238634 RepID=A0AB39TUF1_9ACTN
MSISTGLRRAAVAVAAVGITVLTAGAAHADWPSGNSLASPDPGNTYGAFTAPAGDPVTPQVGSAGRR